MAYEWLAEKYRQATLHKRKRGNRMHLELNEENVMRIYNDCVVTEADLPIEDDDVLATKIFTKNSCGKDSPTIFFKKQKLEEYSDTVLYLYGQLSLVHLNIEKIKPELAVATYQAKLWTRDNNILMALFYLGVANDVIPVFRFDPTEGSLITYNFFLKPTLSPDDPRYKKETC